jgi:hypothetical protein
MGLGLALAVALGAGFFVAALLRPPVSPPWAALLLDAALGAGWGLGTTSAAWFLWLALVGPPATGYVETEIALAAALAGFCILAWRRRGGDPTPPRPPGPPPGRTPRLVVLACLVAVIVSGLAYFAARWSAQPHGEWDSWAMWNLRARFLYRGGEHWHDGFSPVLLWSSPDYPLLLQASVARCWTYLGHEATLAPALLGLLFTFAAAGVLCAAVGSLRGPTQGLLAALVLLGTSLFLRTGSLQIADVPVGFFILAALALLALHDGPGAAGPRGLVLAGMMAGFAAWTKNEGLLFLACLLPVRLALRGRARGWKGAAREALPLLLGLLPVMALVVAYKLTVAPPNDLVSGQGSQTTLGRLTDPTRYRMIADAFVWVFFSIGPWAFVPLGLAFALLGPAPRPARALARLPLLVVVLMLLGFFGVYVLTPRDLHWQLETSLYRLYMQLWPSALLGYFLAVATPEEVAARQRAVGAKAA